MQLVDLGDGDRLAVFVNDGDPDLPRVLLVHGLGGTAESDYVRVTAAGLLDAGFSVARVDLRGAGVSAEYSSGMYHGGKTADLRAVLEILDTPTAVVGYSLGANATIKLLGEGAAGVVAGVSVSAPLDLTEGAEHLHRRAWGFYEKFLVRGLKRDVLRPGARYTPEERQAVADAKTIAEFDSAITAPRHGWRDAWEYYEVNSSAQFLPGVEVPLLVIHAKDDPMIPFGPYQRVEWDALPNVDLLITDHGGHVGFHGRGALPWYVPVIVGFLQRVTRPAPQDPAADGPPANAAPTGR
jgi:predicted alpha/beta-fold hydrolase